MESQVGTATIVRGRSWISAALLFAVLVAPVFLPFFGVLVSLWTLVFAPMVGPRVWPGTTRGTATLYATLALISFWIIPILSFSGVGALASGWFILPLCGPANAAAWLVPAGTAAVVYAAACVVSFRRSLPIAWVAGAGLAMVAYEVAWALMATSGDAWIC